jgi:hypothetical protein
MTNGDGTFLTTASSSTITNLRIFGRRKFTFVELLVYATLFCVPFQLPIVNNFEVWDTGFVAVVGEIPLLGLIFFGGPAAIKGLWKTRDSLLVSVAALVGAMVLSTLVHPNVRGVQICGRAFALLVFCDCVFSKKIRVSSLVKVLIVSNVFQFVLVVYQTATGSGMGFWILGENRNPMFFFSLGFTTALGTFPHPYLYAIFALLCVSCSAVFGMQGTISRKWAYTGGFVGAFLIGAAGSRGSLLSLLGVLLIGMIGLIRVSHERRFRTSLWLSMALGLIPALFWNSALWLAKSAASSGSADRISSGRWELLKGGYQLARANPVFGVGMGQYVNVFRSQPGYVRIGSAETIVHNLGLLLAAEGGLPLALAALALVWVLGLRLRNRGMVGPILIAAIAAEVLLDHSLASLPGGFVVLAMWIVVAGYWNEGASNPNTLKEQFTQDVVVMTSEDEQKLHLAEMAESR